MKTFVRYVTLNVLGTLGISCYILADTFFVSQGLGMGGLAALNIAIPVYNFIHGCGLMLGMGGGTRFTLHQSRGKSLRAYADFTHAVCMALAVAAAFAALGLTCAPALAAMLGADESTLGMSATYLKWLLLFAPAFMMNDVLLCFVRNDGAPRRAMFAMLGGSFANIVLDYVFIFPLEMGIFGAVLATGIAPMISMGILVPHCMRKTCGFRLRAARMEKRAVFTILSLGFPSLLAQVSGGVVMVAFNLIMLRLRGNTGVAAYGVVANLALVVTGVYTGIAEGVQPLLSQACGRRESGEVKRLLRYAGFTVAGVSCLIYAALSVFAHPIAGVFNSEANVGLQSLAAEGIRLYFTSGLCAGVNILLAMFFVSVEWPVPAQALSLLRGLVLVIPFAFWLSAWWDTPGLWLSLTATESVTLVFALLALGKCPGLGERTKEG